MTLLIGLRSVAASSLGIILSSETPPFLSNFPFKLYNMNVGFVLLFFSRKYFFHTIQATPASQNFDPPSVLHITTFDPSWIPRTMAPSQQTLRKEVAIRTDKVANESKISKETTKGRVSIVVRRPLVHPSSKKEQH